MNKDKLLAEAKLRYPVGTKFNSTGGNKNCVVTDSSIILWGGNFISVEESGVHIGSVFSLPDIWAEIISTPVNYINYEIC